jgi:quercetin dioxygenase-like cupin family protein
MPHRVIHIAAGDGPRLFTVDSTATVKVPATATDGAYELFELETPEGAVVPPHRHPWAEAYYVLDGTLCVRVGARQFRLGARDAVTVPPGAIHTTETIDGPCRFLAFSLTDGTGALFTDLDRSIPRDQPIEAIAPLLLTVAERNGVTFPSASAST